MWKQVAKLKSNEVSPLFRSAEISKAETTLIGNVYTLLLKVTRVEKQVVSSACQQLFFPAELHLCYNQVVLSNLTSSNQVSCSLHMMWWVLLCAQHNPPFGQRNDTLTGHNMTRGGHLWVTKTLQDNIILPKKMVFHCDWCVTLMKTVTDIHHFPQASATSPSAGRQIHVSAY